MIIQLWESTDYPSMWDGDLDELHKAVATDTFLLFFIFAWTTELAPLPREQETDLKVFCKF